MPKKVIQLKNPFIPESNVTKIQIGPPAKRPHTLARPLVTCRHALKNIEEYLLGQVNLYQIHPIAVYCLHDYINSSYFSIIHKS